jgi:heat shock 70kDa protein 1/2/6/8
MIKQGWCVVWQAAKLKGNPSEGIKDLLLYDVVSTSLGIETDGDEMTVLVKRNTRIPTSISKIFIALIPYQSEVSIKVLQGEGLLSEENEVLAEFILKGLPCETEERSRIKVHFNIDYNGILIVTAEDVSNTQNSKAIECTPKSCRLSDAEIKRLQDEAKKDATKEKMLLFAENLRLTAKTDLLHAILNLPSNDEKRPLLLAWHNANGNASEEMYRSKLMEITIPKLEGFFLLWNSFTKFSLV